MKYLILLFVVFTLLISCKKQSHKKNILKNRGKEYIDTILIKDSKIKYISLPESVKKNEYFYGKIMYDTDIDTLSESEIHDRLIIFYISKSTSNFDIEDIKKYKIVSYLDTIGNGIYSFKFKLDTLGLLNLKIAIEDMLSLKISKDSVREITDISIFTFNLEVKD